VSAGRAALTFGIYPGGFLLPDQAGPPDDPARINRALDDLQGAAGRPFIVRAYDRFADPDESGRPISHQVPSDYEQYLGAGRRLDLVAQYHSESADIDGFRAFVERLIDRHGEHIATLQIGEEPNVTDNPGLDGFYPRVADALIAGARAAKEKAARAGFPDLKVGCNSTPLFGPAAGYFADLTEAGGEGFIADLDYIGLDFFPDVFRPVEPARLAAVVQALLESHRRDALAPAGLGHLPLVITEHGWPTGPGRPPSRQAEVLRTVVEVVAADAEALQIIGYTHHALRDARTADPGPFSQFGLMTDDYDPKPAFHVYRDLIARHSVGD
jgi:hypothetical protein